MTKTQATSFVPHPAHRAMSAIDAAVFTDASHMLSDYELAGAIRAAGGGPEHLAHFIREQCNGRPVAAWGSDPSNSDADIRDALVRVAEALA